MIHAPNIRTVIGLMVVLGPALIAVTSCAVSAVQENASNSVPCNLSNCTSDRCDLSNCTFSNVTFTNCIIANIKLINCTPMNITERNTRYIPTNFTYSRDGRNYTADYFDENLRPALNWIKANTSNNSVILSWWDYGHMIRGYADRDVVIYAPSRNLNNTLGAPWTPEKGPFSDENMTRDVARALLANNSNETIEVMKKYNATYVFVGMYDLVKSFAMLIAQGEPQKCTMDIKGAFINKALNREEIKGLKLVYYDDYAVIYKRV